MAAHNELGKKGELIAKDYLQNLGYQIREINWRYKRAEVDIIAMDGPVLVFAEVKTRATAAFGRPEEFISQRKEQLLTDAAHAFIDEVNHEWEIRFDFISIIYKSDQRYELEHFKDAFFPGLE